MPVIDVATFLDAGEVPLGDPVQTFRHTVTASPTEAPVFTHPDGAGTLRVEMTPDVDIHYVLGVTGQPDATTPDNGTRKATQGVTFYLFARAGERISVRTEQA